MALAWALQVKASFQCFIAVEHHQESTATAFQCKAINQVRLEAFSVSLVIFTDLSAIPIQSYLDTGNKAVIIGWLRMLIGYADMIHHGACRYRYTDSGAHGVLRIVVLKRCDSSQMFLTGVRGKCLSFRV